MNRSTDWMSKFDEIKSRKNALINILESYENNREIELFTTFKDFCIHCYSLKDWLKKSGKDFTTQVNSDEYLDICRGIANGDKHLKITQHLDSYQSEHYRVSSINFFQSSTGCYTSEDVDLHIDPDDKIIIVETQSNTYDVREIVLGSICSWEKLLKKYGL